MHSNKHIWGKLSLRVKRMCGKTNKHIVNPKHDGLRFIRSDIESQLNLSFVPPTETSSSVDIWVIISRREDRKERNDRRGHLYDAGMSEMSAEFQINYHNVKPCFSTFWIFTVFTFTQWLFCDTSLLYKIPFDGVSNIRTCKFADGLACIGQNTVDKALILMSVNSSSTCSHWHTRANKHTRTASDCKTLSWSQWSIHPQMKAVLLGLMSF